MKKGLTEKQHQVLTDLKTGKVIYKARLGKKIQIFLTEYNAPIAFWEPIRQATFKVLERSDLIEKTGMHGSYEVFRLTKHK